MLTKAYVVKQSNTASNKYVVRIPLFNSINNTKHSTPDNELSEATLATLPASNNVLHPGDCVYVGFENNDLGSPIIIGHLFAETLNDSPIDLTLRKLTVPDSPVSEVKLCKNTTIGNVSADNISMLQGCNLNIRDTFYYQKYYLTETATDNPESIYVGTTWNHLGEIMVGVTPIHVWHRIA